MVVKRNERHRRLKSISRTSSIVQTGNVSFEWTGETMNIQKNTRISLFNGSCTLSKTKEYQASKEEQNKIVKVEQHFLAKVKDKPSTSSMVTSDTQEYTSTTELCNMNYTFLLDELLREQSNEKLLFVGYAQLLRLAKEKMRWKQLPTGLVKYVEDFNDTKGKVYLVMISEDNPHRRILKQAFWKQFNFSYATNEARTICWTYKLDENISRTYGLRFITQERCDNFLKVVQSINVIACETRQLKYNPDVQGRLKFLKNIFVNARNSDKPPSFQRHNNAPHFKRTTNYLSRTTRQRRASCFKSTSARTNFKSNSTRWTFKTKQLKVQKLNLKNLKFGQCNRATAVHNIQYRRRAVNRRRLSVTHLGEPQKPQPKKKFRAVRPKGVRHSPSANYVGAFARKISFKPMPSRKVVSNSCQHFFITLQSKHSYKYSPFSKEGLWLRQKAEEFFGFSYLSVNKTLSQNCPCSTNTFNYKKPKYVDDKRFDTSSTTSASDFNTRNKCKRIRKIYNTKRATTTTMSTVFPVLDNCLSQHQMGTIPNLNTYDVQDRRPLRQSSPESSINLKQFNKPAFSDLSMRKHKVKDTVENRCTENEESTDDTFKSFEDTSIYENCIPWVTEQYATDSLEILHKEEHTSMGMWDSQNKTSSSTNFLPRLADGRFSSEITEKSQESPKTPYAVLYLNNCNGHSERYSGSSENSFKTSDWQSLPTEDEFVSLSISSSRPKNIVIGRNRIIEEAYVTTLFWKHHLKQCEEIPKARGLMQIYDRNNAMKCLYSIENDDRVLTEKIVSSFVPARPTSKRELMKSKANIQTVDIATDNLKYNITTQDNSPQIPVERKYIMENNVTLSKSGVKKQICKLDQTVIGQFSPNSKVHFDITESVVAIDENMSKKTALDDCYQLQARNFICNDIPLSAETCGKVSAKQLGMHNKVESTKVKVNIEEPTTSYQYRNLQETMVNFKCYEDSSEYTNNAKKPRKMHENTEMWNDESINLSKTELDLADVLCDQRKINMEIQKEQPSKVKINEKYESNKRFSEDVGETPITDNTDCCHQIGFIEIVAGHQDSKQEAVIKTMEQEQGCTRFHETTLKSTDNILLTAVSSNENPVNEEVVHENLLVTNFAEDNFKWASTNRDDNSINADNNELIENNGCMSNVSHINEHFINAGVDFEENSYTDDTRDDFVEKNYSVKVSDNNKLDEDEENKHIVSHDPVNGYSLSMDDINEEYVQEENTNLDNVETLSSTTVTYTIEECIQVNDEMTQSNVDIVNKLDLKIEEITDMDSPNAQLNESNAEENFENNDYEKNSDLNTYRIQNNDVIVNDIDSDIAMDVAIDEEFLFDVDASAEKVVPEDDSFNSHTNDEPPHELLLTEGTNALKPVESSTQTNQATSEQDQETEINVEQATVDSLCQEYSEIEQTNFKQTVEFEEISNNEGANVPEIINQDDSVAVNKLIEEQLQSTDIEESSDQNAYNPIEGVLSGDGESENILSSVDETVMDRTDKIDEAEQFDKVSTVNKTNEEEKSESCTKEIVVDETDNGSSFINTAQTECKVSLSTIIEQEEEIYEEADVKTDTHQTAHSQENHNSQCDDHVSLTPTDHNIETCPEQLQGDNQLGLILDNTQQNIDENSSSIDVPPNRSLDSQSSSNLTEVFISKSQNISFKNIDNVAELLRQTSDYSPCLRSITATSFPNEVVSSSRIIDEGSRKNFRFKRDSWCFPSQTRHISSGIMSPRSPRAVHRNKPSDSEKGLLVSKPTGCSFSIPFNTPPKSSKRDLTVASKKTINEQTLSDNKRRILRSQPLSIAASVRKKKENTDTLNSSNRQIGKQTVTGKAVNANDKTKNTPVAPKATQRKSIFSSIVNVNISNSSSNRSKTSNSSIVTTPRSTRLISNTAGRSTANSNNKIGTLKRNVRPSPRK